MKQINIAVVGGGVGGKGLVALLLKRLRKSLSDSSLPQLSFHVSLIDKQHLSPSLVHQHATGLWGKGCRTLVEASRNLTVEELRTDYSASVGESGYRCQDGRWLMKPLNGMKTFPDEPSLSFLANCDIMHILDDSIASEELSLKGHHSISFHRVPTHIQDIVAPTSLNSSSNRISLIDEDGVTHHADIVVASDGMHSLLRSKLFPGINPEYNGYRVFRGFLEPFEAADLFSSEDKRTPSFVSFQTWGEGARFAVVPTHNNGIAWFAAVSFPNPSTHSHLNGKRALENGSRQCNESELSVLHRTFHTGAERYVHNNSFKTVNSKRWHAPIAQIINSTPTERLCITDAYAFSQIHEVLLGPTYYGGNQSSTAVAPAVYFLGDAAHTLDPILAQGAGVALEEADMISNHLLASYFPLKGEASGAETLKKQRLERLRVLHRISRLSQSLGHMHSENLIKLRNASLRIPYYIAPNIVGRTFDSMISLASGKSLI